MCQSPARAQLLGTATRTLREGTRVYSHPAATARRVQHGSRLRRGSSFLQHCRGLQGSRQASWGRGGSEPGGSSGSVPRLWWEQSLQQREQVRGEMLGSRQGEGEQADRGAGRTGVMAVTAHPLEVLRGRDKQNNGLHSVPTNGIPTNMREGSAVEDGPST